MIRLLFYFPRIKTTLHPIWCKPHTFAVHYLALNSDNTIFEYENEGCEENYGTWSIIFIRICFVNGFRYPVQYGGNFHQRTLVAIIILLETLLGIKWKNTKGLHFYFGSLQFTPDKYARHIWQLRRTIEKYVVNVWRGWHISHTLRLGKCWMF